MNEKSGYACLFNDEISNGGKEILSKYGEIIVNFKKESVEGKMTYYLGDSLAAYTNKDRGEDPHLGVVGGKNGGTTLSGALVIWNQDVLTAANNCEMDPFAYVADNGYLEVQFLGDLSVDDIASIGFLDAKDYDNLPVELKEFLKQKNIDVVIRNL
jgi:hypothetical protein